MTSSRLCIGALTLTAMATSLAGAEADCVTHPKRVAACRGVHGRLALWNGAPSERIWVVGTKRMLGVTGRSERSLPSYLQEQLTWDVNIYGDFWVCPLFDPPRAGHMEFVCVHSWRNLVVEATSSSSEGARVRRISPGPAPRWPTEPR